jgi:hypothetical protein
VQVHAGHALPRPNHAITRRAISLSAILLGVFRFIKHNHHYQYQAGSFESEYPSEKARL